MNRLFFFLIACLALLMVSCNSQVAKAQTHRLEKIGETDTVMAIPESVLPDLAKGIFYISLIDGPSWDVDGKGGIGILGPDIKKYNSTWITGLNAPKGMGFLGNRLYVADVTDVVVIDVPNGKIEKKIPLDGAKGLNDITVTEKGVVYVSDSRTGRVWQLEKDIPVLFLDSLQGVNGLKAVGQELYIGAGKNFIKAGPDKKITKLAELPQGIDGIEPVGNGDFILTSWGGYIYYVSADGKFETLLDSHLEKMNTADIGYDPAKKIVYVPTFNARKIVMYQLK